MKEFLLQRLRKSLPINSNNMDSLPSVSDLTGIGLSALVIILWFKYATNHSHDLTEEIRGLRQAIIDLKDWLQENK